LIYQLHAALIDYYNPNVPGKKFLSDNPIYKNVACMSKIRIEKAQLTLILLCFQPMPMKGVLVE